MDNVAQQIKAKLGVEQVLKQYLELLPAGKNFKAKCPFHNEKTASFMVSPERDSWHCFGCNEGGDIFTFLMKYENIEFFEALKILAEKAGIEIKRVSPEQQRQFGVLYDSNEEAKNFYKNKLKSEQKAIDYLRERGVTGETAGEFEIGMSGVGWDELLVYLVGKGFEVNDLVRAGLIVKNDRGNFYDRFRNRIMFPIFNHTGKTVGFSGRVMPGSEDEQMAKYVNSSESPIFSKSKILYGFDKTKGFIRETGQAVVVEGQMDVVMAYQDGVRNVVASGGTALTQDHLQALGRITKEVVFNFDNDEAGRRAGERAIDMAGSEDMAVKVLVLEEVKDVAEMVKEKPGEFKKALAEKMMPAMEFYFSRYLTEEAMKEVVGKKEGIRMILKKLIVLPSAIEKEYWLKDLSRRVGISEDSLQAEMKLIKKGETSENNPVGGGVRKEVESVNEGNKVMTRSELISQRLISASLATEEGIKMAEVWQDYMPDNFKKVLGIMIKDEKIEVGTDLDKLINLIHLRSGMAEEEKVEELGLELKIEWLKADKQNCLDSIRNMERKGENLTKAMDRFKKVTAELDKIIKER